MLSQRISWLFAPGRVIDLSIDRASRQSSSSLPPLSRPTTPTPIGTPLYDRLSMSVRALPAIPSSSIRPLPNLPSLESLATTTTVRPLPAVPSMSATSLTSVDEHHDDASQWESEVNPTRPSPLSRLHKKKRHLQSVDSLAVSLPGVDFQMIPQHHLQTQTQTSPPSPSTPNKPPRLNLGLFSSRSRKESSTPTRPSTPGSAGVFMRSGSDSCEDTHLNPLNSVRKRGSTIVRCPSPGASATETMTRTAPPLPPKPAKLKAHAHGLFNSAMEVMTRGSVMPTSPSIAAAIEYMRHEQDPPRRAVLDEKRDTIYGLGSREQLQPQLTGSSRGTSSREQLATGSQDRLAQEQLGSRDTLDEESDAESRKVHGQPSISDFGPGHKASFSDAGKSTFSDAGKSSFSDTGATSSGPSSSVNSLLSNNTGTGTSAHTDHDHDATSADHDHDGDVSCGSDSSCFDPALTLNPTARPQSRAQDPDKRVSTASSQRTLTAWNTGGFVFPNTSTVEHGAPLARLHTTDGNLDDPALEPEPVPKATPRPARLGQLAGSLKRRSASMSILLPPMMSPRSDLSSEASSPRFMPTSPPPPLPTRARPRAHFDGAVTDSESTTSLFRKRSRRVQGGIKGKIAAWTAAADQTRPKKPMQRERGDEPRRSDTDSPQQGYPYSHSPASAPALQVHTHVHLPAHAHAHAQTPLMSIAALAPAARDLALGVGKRVEKFYRARSASGAGHEPRPSLGGMRTRGGGLGLGVEPVLSALLRPAIPGASGLLFGRTLDDPVVPRDMDGWVDETLGVRRCVGLPVFVSRSVRHLERWGGDEEGLFRISGRPGHVSRLRAEFDAGADYDLVEIPPGDLDPHAVSHLFKAYLRQLPEPILTRALKSQFDMAMTTTDSTTTTSMTSFGESSEHMRSLDDALLSDIKILIDQLPNVNYTLLHELVHVLRYTTQHAHTTKMPIGNLLLLFCPTLGLSAGFLRCLVEGQDVLFDWGRRALGGGGGGGWVGTRTIKTSVSTVTGPSLGVVCPVPPRPSPTLPPRPSPTLSAKPSPTPSSKPSPSPGPSKHAPSASTSAAPSSIRSIKSPLTIDSSSPRARSQTTAGPGSGPPSRASMFFPHLPKRPSISRLFGVGNSNYDLISSIPHESRRSIPHDSRHSIPHESRHSSSSGESYLSSDDDHLRVHPKRQTLPPRVSLDIPDGSFAPSLSPTKDMPEAESGVLSSTTRRPAQTPIADMFKSPLTAAVPTTAPSVVTATAVPTTSQTLPPKLGLGLQLTHSTDADADEMGWSRGVLDAAAASASLGR
ncbi:unnamed protein product [Rhizoctonia solani]|nr:unnamed protein product [Rhizoctonia solani]